MGNSRQKFYHMFKNSLYRKGRIKVSILKHVLCSSKQSFSSHKPSVFEFTNGLRSKLCKIMLNFIIQFCSISNVSIGKIST